MEHGGMGEVLWRVPGVSLHLIGILLAAVDHMFDVFLELSLLAVGVKFTCM